MPKGPIDTANKYMIGVHGEDIVVLQAIPHRISRGDALLLAAWLVALADHSEDEADFKTVLAAVQNT